MATPQKVKSAGELPAAIAQDAIAVDTNPVEVQLRNFQPLYKAALNGDWKSAKRFFDENPNVDKMAPITPSGQSALHVATDVGQTRFVAKLVPLLKEQDLEMKDDNSRTALHNAAIYGSLSAVKILVRKNRKLTQISNRWGYTPLAAAAYNAAGEEVLWFLALNTTDDPPSRPFTGNQAGYLIRSLANSGYYDICLHLLKSYPNLAITETSQKRGSAMLSVLVNKPSDFLSGRSNLGFWEKCIYHLIPMKPHHGYTDQPKQPIGSINHDVEDSQLKVPPRSITNWTQVLKRAVGAALNKAAEYAPGIRHIKDEKYKHKCTLEFVEIVCEQISHWDVNRITAYFEEAAFTIDAAKNGQAEIIEVILQYFPYLAGCTINGSNILREAIKERREDVFNLMLKKSVTTRLLANLISGPTGETVLHFAAKLAPYSRLTSISCAALQMQRELQWFKVVEMFVTPHYKTHKAKDSGLTAREVFTNEHKELIKDAVEWMKDTSNSCMVVAALITTVAFAAAFTVPGGNIDGQGTPLFLNKRIFVLFAVSDALSMFSSTTSILMFLSILTARYAEEDFLHALPKRLILGFC